jgi:Rod binding domain-containing protein
MNGILPSGSTASAAGSVKGAGAATAKDAARQFEALFASMMVHSMRKGVEQLDNNSFMPTSTGEKIFTDMLDDQYGNLLAKNGTLGLADVILKQIDKTGGSPASLSMLKGLSTTQPWMLDNKFVPSTSTAAGSVVPETGSGLSQWQQIIQEASSKYGVDKSLISAVIAQESAGNRFAVSNKGAKGLMQLTDSTARDMGVSSVFQPTQNIMGGTKYLKKLLDKYNGNETLALASYNAGPAAVDKYNGIPPFEETQRYVGNVLSLRSRFAEKPSSGSKQ